MNPFKDRNTDSAWQRRDELRRLRRLHDYYKPDDFLKYTSAILLDRSEKGNELYMVELKITDHYDSKLYFLRYQCPSTDKVYLKGIKPEIGLLRNANLAQAWSFGLTLEEYRGLEAES
ncbi:MAG: hypothetical protein ABSH41_31040 [Syntrophobacteraceae bacterium]